MSSNKYTELKNIFHNLNSFVIASAAFNHRHEYFEALPSLLLPFGLTLNLTPQSTSHFVFENGEVLAAVEGHGTDMSGHIKLIASLISSTLTMLVHKKHQDVSNLLAKSRLWDQDQGGLTSILKALTRVIGCQSSTIYNFSENSYLIIASSGQPVDLNHDLQKKLLRAVKSAKAQWPDSNGAETHAIIPLSSEKPSRYLLLMGPFDKSLTTADQTLLLHVGRILEHNLHEFHKERRRTTLLELEEASLESRFDDLLQHVVERAVTTVPGAEAGSLILKQGETYAFAAAYGFDMDVLKDITFSSEDMANWYYKLPDAWTSHPRILKFTRKIANNLIEKSHHIAGLEGSGRLSDIRSNLFLPILYHGELLGVLNLDNLHHTWAFAKDSLEGAELFMSIIPILLREQSNSKRLELVAETDMLTGLGNRRAFEKAIAHQEKIAMRYRQVFSLLVFDLGNFKKINDTYGHLEGDKALQKVAMALSHVKRDSDLLYRWGGDEFAILLPLTALEGAMIAAQRFCDGVESVHVGDIKLYTSVGIASFPKCAETTANLISLADQRMYKDKEVRKAQSQYP